MRIKMKEIIRKTNKINTKNNVENMLKNMKQSMGIHII
jgi:hypothetical protein